MNHNLPFDAIVISGAHSTLTGVLAGFALTAFFLLLDRMRDTKNTRIRKQYLRSMLLLFAAFLIGSLASFLYSGITGDPPLRAFFDFLFPSSIFAIHTIVLLYGMNALFSTLETNEILSFARYTNYLIVMFVMERIWDDISNEVEYFGLHPQMRWWLLAIAAVPIVISFLLLLLKKDEIWIWVDRNTFTYFYPSVVISSFVVAVIEGTQNTLLVDQIKPSEWIFVLLMSYVSLFGAWSILLSPHRSVMKRR